MEFQMKPNRKSRTEYLISVALSLWILLTASHSAHASVAHHKAAGASSSSSSSSSGGEGRQKVIDFEDEVVEGMNKRPLDSVSQISERDKNRHKPHLYRKRASFRSETLQSLHEQRYIQ